MSLLNSNGRLILLHKGLNSIKKASKYDFVLSPQFYISKREQLPVKYAFQAKKLAPSILDDLLPNEYGYEYVAIKDGEYWQLFAYSPKEIENFLKGCCNISANKIGNIYFADQLNNILYKIPVGVDNKNALVLIDNKATIVPRSMIDSDKFAKFTSKLRPKKAIKFKPSSKKSSVNSKFNKGAILVAILLLLLGVAFIIEAFDYKKEIASQEKKINDLFLNNPSLKGKSIRDSIKSKYEKIEKEQRAVRELLDKYSKLSSKRVILQKLEMKDDKLIAKFSVEPSYINRAMSIAKSSNLKVNKSGSNTLNIEGSLK